MGKQTHNWPIWMIAGLSILVTLVVAAVFFTGGYWKYFVKGPGEVMAVKSPNGTYNAFVLESPSIDGPNQSLFIETADQKQFLKIADLVEDIDSIIDIIWSPDSSAVVFWSHDYITVVRVEDWRITRELLGRPWTREQQGKRSTFHSGDSQAVDWVKFEDSLVKYQLTDTGTIQEINY